MARRKATPRTSHIDGRGGGLYDGRRVRRESGSRAPYFILIGILAVGVVVSLVCALRLNAQNVADESDVAANGNKWAALEPGTEYDIFFDQQTGVYYCMFEKDGNMAVTPLYNIDGLPLVVDDVNHSDEGIDSVMPEIHQNLVAYGEGNGVG